MLVIIHHCIERLVGTGEVFGCEIPTLCRIRQSNIVVMSVPTWHPGGGNFVWNSLFIFFDGYDDSTVVRIVSEKQGFFIAGCLAIVAGASSRLGAGQEWRNFQLPYAESFRGMSSSERANFIVEASSSIGLVILGLLSGILLILISVFVTRMF